jgi:hypothetical protein
VLGPSPLQTDEFVVADKRHTQTGAGRGDAGRTLGHRSARIVAQISPGPAIRSVGTHGGDAMPFGDRCTMTLSWDWRRHVLVEVCSSQQT